MSTGLSFTDCLYSADYMAPYNKMSGYDAVMMVETVNDRDFWSNLSKNAVPDKKIKINPISRAGKADGKRAMEALYQKASKHLILAIDSDYDYSAQMDSGNSKTVNDNKYIIQTFVYSKESVVQHYEVLDKFTSKLPLYTTNTLNVKEYLESYSSAIYGLMAVHLYLKSKGNDDFELAVKEAIKPEAPLFDKNYNELNGVIDKLRKKADALKSKLLNAIQEDDDLQAFIINLTLKGITDTTMYSYINGHVLEDNIVKPLLKSAKKACFKFEKDEVSKMHPGVKTQALTDKIRNIKNRIEDCMDTDTYLHTTDNTYQAPHAKKIIESIQKAFQ